MNASAATRSTGQVSSFSIEVSGERAAEIPTVYTEILLTFKIRGPQLTQELVERAVQLSEEKYCSVGIMLGKTARIKTIIVLEDGELGQFPKLTE